jgi:hypothetical protein
MSNYKNIGTTRELTWQARYMMRAAYKSIIDFRRIYSLNSRDRRVHGVVKR